MQITEEIRKNILFVLPKMSAKEARKISRKSKVSIATVWRQWRKIRSTDPVCANRVTLAIAELAARKKKDVVNEHKRLASIEKQLSGVASQ